MVGRSSHIVPLLVITLLAVSLIEAGYLALEYFVFRQEEQLAPAAFSQADVAEKSGEVVEVSADHNIILERNLFGTPAAAEDAAVEQQEASSETPAALSLNLVLIGTVVGDSLRAFILDQSNKRQDVYEVGDMIQGAMVDEIGRGNVKLSLNGREQLLDLSDAAKVRPQWQGPVEQGWNEQQAGQAVDQPPPAVEPQPAPELIQENQTMQTGSEDGEVRSRLVRQVRRPQPSGAGN